MKKIFGLDFFLFSKINYGIHIGMMSEYSNKNVTAPHWWVLVSLWLRYISNTTVKFKIKNNKLLKAPCQLEVSLILNLQKFYLTILVIGYAPYN